MHKIVLIGYSGHAFVVCDILSLLNYKVVGYCDIEMKEFNPFDSLYLGTEANYLLNEDENYIIGIGDNIIREKIAQRLNGEMINAIHPGATISKSVLISSGVVVAANATINPLSQLGRGAIINTGAIVEHECKIGDFAHIAPGAVLTGNVHVGDRSFIGANSVIKQGVIIGNDVIVGAGSVILNDVPDGVTIVGNPGRIIKENK